MPPREKAPVRRKKIDATEVAQPDALTVGEIGKSAAPTERTTPTDLTGDAIDNLAFMNQELEIMVHPDNQEGSYDVVTVTVNGLNQPIIRGKKQTVKRKYVEAMARARTTTYHQTVPDPSKPHVRVMTPNAVLTYPFSIMKDPDERGQEWLMGILQEK